MKPLEKSKFICPACFGNGYRRITKDASNPHLKVAISCEACNNQGEILNNEKNIHALRYLNYML
jgi:DnaJ-class molecular chaperone